MGVLGKGKSWYKGTGAGMCVACLRNTRKSSCWSRVNKGESGGRGVGGIVGLQIM